MRADRAELLQDFLPGSERIRALDEKIAAFAREVEAEPETVTRRLHLPNPRRAPLESQRAEQEVQLQGFLTERRTVAAQFERLRRTVDEMGPWELELSRLTAERERAQSQVTMLSDKLQDLEIRSRTRMQMARKIENAGVPGAPIRPRTTTNLVFSAALALCMAVGVVLLLEHLDDRVNSPEDLEPVTALPTLGLVPLLAASQPRLLSALPAHSPAAESYRGLRSSIGFAGIDAPIRRLQITSPSKGEGKTVTSLNLATAMAMDGKRVVLVDADLRRPGVHRVLDLPGSPGLSDVLAGNCTVEEALRETPIENLRILSSGETPPNPAELLGSSRFESVLERLEEEADVLVFDSPPCLPVSDPLIMAGRMDGVVLVIHASHTRKAAIAHALELLARARARVLGVLFNRVEVSRGGYYYYYRYYGDGYYGAETGPAPGNGRWQRRSSLGEGAREPVSPVEDGEHRP